MLAVKFVEVDAVVHELWLVQKRQKIAKKTNRENSWVKKEGEKVHSTKSSTNLTDHTSIKLLMILK